MRTTVTLDPDVHALIEAERTKTGETFRQVINRLIRRSVATTDAQPLPLPVLPGRPLIDIRDTSAVLAALDDERWRERGLP